MLRWNSLSLAQKSEIIGAGLGPVSLPYSDLEVASQHAPWRTDRTVVGWGISRIVVSVRTKK